MSSRPSCGCHKGELFSSPPNTRVLTANNNPHTSLKDEGKTLPHILRERAVFREAMPAIVSDEGECFQAGVVNPLAISGEHQPGFCQEGGVVVPIDR